MLSPEESLVIQVLDKLVTDSTGKKEVQNAIKSNEAKKLFGALPKIKRTGAGLLIGLGAASGGLAGAASKYVDNRTRGRTWRDWLRKEDNTDGIGREAIKGMASGAVAMPASFLLSNVVNAARVDKGTVNSLSKQFKVPTMVRHLNKVLGGSNKLVGRSAVAASAIAPVVIARYLANKIYPDRSRK